MANNGECLRLNTLRLTPWEVVIDPVETDSCIFMHDEIVLHWRTVHTPTQLNYRKDFLKVINLKDIVQTTSNRWSHLVGSAHPGGEEAPKGWSVRPLKRYVSWVQTVVRQVGLYPLSALDF